MTYIADILLEFFSPLSKEKVWVMSENDNYTKRVRDWVVVKEAVRQIKFDLDTNASTWQNLFMTDKMWHPSLMNSKIVERSGKRGAHWHEEEHPPETAPMDCVRALAIYAITRPNKALGFGYATGQDFQPDNLYTSAIGSFSIYTTLDKFDNNTNTATMNFWMFNAMTKRSFGTKRSADFKLCGMKSQYMWWNWVEVVDWNSGIMRSTMGWR